MSNEYKTMDIVIRYPSDGMIFDEIRGIKLKHRKDGSFTSTVQKAFGEAIKLAFCGHKVEIKVK